MDEQVQAYAYLWTTQKREWVLLADEESQQRGDYIIYHIKSWRFLNIPDRAVRRAVIAEMLAAKMPVVTDEDVFGRK